MSSIFNVPAAEPFKWSFLTFVCTINFLLQNKLDYIQTVLLHYKHPKRFCDKKYLKLSSSVLLSWSQTNLREKIAGKASFALKQVNMIADFLPCLSGTVFVACEDILVYFKEYVLCVVHFPRYSEATCLIELVTFTAPDADMTFRGRRIKLCCVTKSLLWHQYNTANTLRRPGMDGDSFTRTRLRTWLDSFANSSYDVLQRIYCNSCLNSEILNFDSGKKVF